MSLCVKNIVATDIFAKLRYKDEIDNYLGVFMKFISMLSFSLIFSNLSYSKVKKKCSLAYTMKPMCYHKRTNPVLKVALVHYGNTMKMKDLDRVSSILKERFLKATGRAVELDIIEKMVLPFKHKLPEDFKFNGITDKDRLHRIWYYENVGSKVMSEVYYEYRTASTWKVLNQLDAILTITGAQFDGLGFASGRISVTEYPREIAWGLEDQGRVEYPSDYVLVDELIHELGHNMFLGHSSSQCQKPGLTLAESTKCCASSENKNDVLSYCRKRAKVSEEIMYGFEACNRDMIKNKIVPAMLKGAKWNIENRTKCL